MTCGNIALLKPWKRLAYTSQSELGSVTRKGWRGERWTAGTDAILGCLLLTIYDNINCPFSLYFTVIYPSPLGNWPLLRDQKWKTATWAWPEKEPFTCLKRGKGQSWQGSQKKLAVFVFSCDSPVTRTKAGRLLRWNPTYASCTAAVSSSSGTSPGPLTWLLCNYSDTQPLTITAMLPVDQSKPFLARRACGCEKYRVYAI